MYINLTWNGRVCVRVSFLCQLWACLPNPTTLEWIDQQPFAKTEMRYISLPSDLNATIAIKSCYCVIQNMVILYDAIQTIQNSVFVFFLKKEQRPVSFQKKKKKRIKKTCELFFFKLGFFQPWLSFNPFLWFSLDRTIWNKSRHYQFDWVCAPHLKYRSLVLKKLRITGIAIRKK